MQPVKSLAHCTLGHNANSTQNVCTTGIYKVCKSTPNEDTKVQLPIFIHTVLKFAKLVDPKGMKVPNFMPLRLILS